MSAVIYTTVKMDGSDLKALCVLDQCGFHRILAEFFLSSLHVLIDGSSLSIKNYSPIDCDKIEYN